MESTGTTFTAPWSSSLKRISSIISVLLLSTVMLSFLVRPKPEGLAVLALALFPLVVLGCAACFTIRSYELTDNKLVVNRLFWGNRFAVAGMRSAFADNQAMAKAWRIGGNGGLFSFSGYFRNAKLGTFRAFVTDPRHMVVIEFSDGKKFVLSPGGQDEFVRALNAAIAKSQAAR